MVYLYPFVRQNSDSCSFIDSLYAYVLGALTASRQLVSVSRLISTSIGYLPIPRIKHFSSHPAKHTGRGYSGNQAATSRGKLPKLVRLVKRVGCSVRKTVPWGMYNGSMRPKSHISRALTPIALQWKSRSTCDPSGIGKKGENDAMVMENMVGVVV